MTTSVRNSILATLAYYDIINMPLTLIEVYNYLINPSRLSLVNRPIKDLRVSSLMQEIDDLIRLDVIGHKNGFYCLRGREDLYGLRIEKMKIADQKWKKFLMACRWLQMVPYVRGIFASGSLAMNNTDPKSDFDVLMIVKTGRIYTARLILLSLTSLLRSRRRWFDVEAPDKFCFNHHISEDALHIRHHSLFNAQSYAHLKPVFVPRVLFDKFFLDNKWINKFLFNFRPSYDFLRRSINKNHFLIFIARFWEVILNTRLGDLVEYLAKKYQQKRIKNNPATYSSGGRIVFNDQELEFHPNSFEKFLIDRYNHTIKKLGIIAPFEEKDSGLS